MALMQQTLLKDMITLKFYLTSNQTMRRCQISENTVLHELTEVEIINDISLHCLQHYKESKINDQSTLSTNMIAPIELLSPL